MDYWRHIVRVSVDAAMMVRYALRCRAISLLLLTPFCHSLRHVCHAVDYAATPMLMPRLLMLLLLLCHYAMLLICATRLRC